MIDLVPVRDTEVKASTITNHANLVGRVPKSFIKAGLPVQDSDVAVINLVEVPVLSVELGRDNQIEKREITTARFNAAELPGDVVLDVSQLIGRTPRRLIPAGAPLRHSDVQLVRKIHVPVAIRDLARGATLTAADLTTISMNDADVAPNVLTDTSEIVGRATKHGMRAGQMMHSFDIARPTAVERGRPITIVYAVKAMNLTVQGVAQESGGVGDVIRVTNSKSNQTFAAEVVDAHTVRVLVQQTASLN
jgi:flagella basal body P-ring formation protein FlgA